ncbi:PH domain-containing protein [Streptomyces sp. NPDC090026]|uniref:PH domain-containing protein n=1 Tax=Streptomyces sp. NPDC090026 TaxID=3365923 RepID=UPI0038159D0D
MTPPDQPAQPAPDADGAHERVHRSTGAMVGGAVMLALAGWITVDAVLRGEGRTLWLVLAGALLAVPLIVAFTFRPAVWADGRRLRIRNPFRTIVLPWSTVADVRAGYSSEVFTEGGDKYQLWSIPVSLRQRKQAARRQARAGSGGPRGRAQDHTRHHDSRPGTAPADQAVAELREMAERLGSAPQAQGEVRVRWAYEVLAPAATGAVLLAVLLATG